MKQVGFQPNEVVLGKFGTAGQKRPAVRNLAGVIERAAARQKRTSALPASL